jgi:hypothetical protein
LLGAGADLAGRPELSRAAKTGAAAAIAVAGRAHPRPSPAGPVPQHDAGLQDHLAHERRDLAARRLRPGRRGGRRHRAHRAAATHGGAATGGAALLGPAVAAYTAVLIGDTAVPARNLTLLGAAMEAAALERMTRRIGMTAEPYHTGRGGAYLRACKILGALGAAGAAVSGIPAIPAGRPRQAAAAASGAVLLAASAATRWGVFHAGMASARDPKYTVVPQRQRLTERAAASGSPRRRRRCRPP